MSWIGTLISIWLGCRRQGVALSLCGYTGADDGIPLAHRQQGEHTRPDGSVFYLGLPCVTAVVKTPHSARRIQTMTHAVQAVLDEMGAEAGCTVVNHEGDLVVGRPEAVYFYTTDGRGPCFVFEGRAQPFWPLWCFMLPACPTPCLTPH